MAVTREQSISDTCHRKLRNVTLLRKPPVSDKSAVNENDATRHGRP